MGNRSALALAAILLLSALAFRTFVTGWGPPDEPTAARNTVFGLTDYPADNLSYISWAEQARHGRWVFEILYTTTEHERVLFNPLFLAVGRVASAAAASPLVVLNALAAFSLPVVVLCFAGICRSVGLGRGTSLVATALAVGGGGLSWVREVLHRAGISEALAGSVGPDLYFYDIYPIVAFFVAPYHALALALLAILVLLIVRTDDPARPLGAAMLAALLGAGALVASVRPHISVMILAAQGAAIAASLVFGLERVIVRRRLIVASVLAAATIPPFVYAVWVAQHPVWIDYANAHPEGEFNEWAVGFMLLWILAAAGAAALGTRLLRPGIAFLAAWAAGSGVLLMALNGFLYPKMTYGVTLALAVLAGAGLETFRRQTRSSALVSAAMATLAVLALASPVMMLSGVVRIQGTTASSELFEAIDRIEAHATRPFPAVLTDCGTGVMLPGLGGARVFCGHWALTDGNREKIVLLSQLGFAREGRAIPTFDNVTDTDVRSRAVALGDQLAGGTFDYLMMEKTDRLYERVRTAGGGCTVHDGRVYVVLTMCPGLQELLVEDIRRLTHHPSS